MTDIANGVLRRFVAESVRWVGQEDAEGCGVACLAMLTGRTYRAIRDEIDAINSPHDWSRAGATIFTWDRVLYRYGFFIQRWYDTWCDEWPCKPFAPLHMVSVKQPSGNSHNVVMDAEGVVFDPLCDGRFTLADWSQVNNIAGLIRDGGK